MKTSVINSILLTVFMLNAFGCVYNQANHHLQDAKLQAMVNTDID